MTDDVTPTPALDAEPPHPAAAAAGPGGRRSSADVTARRPAYKGEDLDAARGPGFGCFWFQAAVLAFFLVLIPIGVTLDWPYEILAALLFVVLGLLLFVGQTLIFLLRLVAADRRDAGRRRPLASATPTVGELEDSLPDGPGAGEGGTAVEIAPETVGIATEVAGIAPEAAESTETAGTVRVVEATEAAVPPTAEPGSEGVRE